jgi:hypothetical protein
MNSSSTIGLPAVPWIVVTPVTALNGGARVRLQHPAEFEIVGEVLPDGRRRTRWRRDRAADHESVALVVVRASPVLRKVERLDRRTKKNSPTLFMAFDNV